MHISEVQKKIQKKFFCLRDNAVWICCCKFFILLPEYFSSVVNALTNSLKVSYQTEGDFF